MALGPRVFSPMLRYRVGRGGTALAVYYQRSDNVPEMRASDKLATYYAANPEVGAAVQALPGTHATVQAGLGIDPSKPLTTGEFANILSGKRADGSAIPGKSAQTKNTFIDFTFYGPKSFSVAMAFASPDERNLLAGAYRTALTKLINHISDEIGTASIGANTGNRNRPHNREPAHIAVFPIQHTTARPTVQIAVDGDTKIYELKIAGDPHWHTHIIVPNAAFTESGRVTSIHQDGLKGRIHEWGALGQAFLATELRKGLGVEVEFDNDPSKPALKRMSRLSSIPQWVDDLFSKRGRKGEEIAREYAAKQGLDWDTMAPRDRERWVTNSVLKSKLGKDASLGEFASWMAQGAAAGYEHRSVLRPGREQEPAPIHERHAAAYRVALPLVEEEFERRAVIEGSTVRAMAAKALISTGVEDAREVSDITRAMRTEGVVQDGTRTALHHAYDPGHRYARVTTQLSVELETEAIGLLKAAYEDKSVRIPREIMDRAVAEVSARDGLDFTTPHGLAQRAQMDSVGEGSRAWAGVGIAGSGKSTTFLPVVHAMHAMGRDTWGTTNAWRQTEGLKDAGVGGDRRPKRRRHRRELDKSRLTGWDISPDRIMALRPFIKAAQKGELLLTPNSTLFLDELGQIGTRDVLDLGRLRAQYGFQLVMTGDYLQNQNISAGNPFEIVRRAFGAVPELTSSIRQIAAGEREIETVTMWREGRAAEALARRLEEGRLHIVPGGYSDTVRASVDLWWKLREENKDTPKYTLAISAPTNADTRAISEEIRGRRRAAGEIGPDLLQLMTVDQNPASVPANLRVAAGDRMRLFDRVHGRDPATGRSAIVGSNGSVVTVLDADNSGMVVQKASGGIAKVKWDSLRQEGGPIRLAYGDAVTGNARQSETVTDHITVMPAGSSAVNAFQIYPLDSRHRRTSHIVTSQGAEKSELRERWPLGDPRGQENDKATVQGYILENMAKNLSRQDRKTLAVEMMETGKHIQMGTLLADRGFHAEDYEARSARDAARQAAEAEAARLAGLLRARSEILAKADEALERFDAWQERAVVAAEAAAVVEGRSSYGEAMDALTARLALPTTANLDELDARVERLGDKLRDAIENMDDDMAEKAQRGPQITQEERNRIAEQHVATTTQQQQTVAQQEQLRQQERQQDRDLGL
jgi:hypothetical protein